MASAIVQKIIGGEDAVGELTALLKSKGVQTLADDTLEVLQTQMEDGNKKKADQRKAALTAFSAICEELGQVGEPFTSKLIASVLKLYGDKEKSVREAAEECGPKIVSNLPGYAVKVVVPLLLQSMTTPARPPPSLVPSACSPRWPRTPLSRCPSACLKSCPWCPTL